MASLSIAQTWLKASSVLRKVKMVRSKWLEGSCGAPLRGDVVAKMASDSFRGTRRLQIFPSQQAVHVCQRRSK